MNLARMRYNTPLTYEDFINDILLISKYIICSCIALGILFAPAWIARQNGHGKPKMHAVRMGSWVFGWSIIGWFVALFWATRK